jgi:hypothetical protein
MRERSCKRKQNLQNLLIETIKEREKRKRDQAFIDEFEQAIKCLMRQMKESEKNIKRK